MEKKVTFGVRLYNKHNMAIVIKEAASGVTIVRLDDFFNTRETTTAVWQDAGFAVRWVYDPTIMNEIDQKNALRNLAQSFR